MSGLSIASIWQTAKLREKLIIVVGLLYILLPFDFIPEVILGPLGLLDDGGALLAVGYTLMGVINRHKRAGSRVIDGEEVNR